MLSSSSFFNKFNAGIFLSLILYFIYLYYFPLLAVFSSVFIVLLIRNLFLKDVYSIVLIAIFSLLICIRDIHLSNGVGGYGSDMIHYLAAFEELANVSFLDTFIIAKEYTSSNDFTFWSLSFFLSNQLSPILVWFSLSFVSLVLLYFSLRVINVNGALVCLFCYVCTITFYTTQGSALRQSLAFSLFLCSVVFVFYVRDRKTGFLFGLFSISSHGSGLVSLFNFIPNRWYVFFDDKKKIVLLFLIIPIIPFFLYLLGKFLPESYYLTGKISSRLEYQQDVSWYWIPQFIFENIFVYFLFAKVLKVYNIKFAKIHLFFFFLVLSLLSLPEIGTRLYRYTYVFFMLHFAYYISVKNNIYLCYFTCFLFFSWWFFLFSGRYDGLYSGSIEELLSLNLYRLIYQW